MNDTLLTYYTEGNIVSASGNRPEWVVFLLARCTRDNYLPKPMQGRLPDQDVGANLTKTCLILK